METENAVQVLNALAQESRLRIFRVLVEAGPGGLAAGRLSEVLGVPAPTLSFHLKELHQAGLVTSRQEGRFIYYNAHYPTMKALVAFLTHNCCQGQTC